MPGTSATGLATLPHCTIHTIVAVSVGPSAIGASYRSTRKRVIGWQPKVYLSAG